MGRDPELQDLVHEALARVLTSVHQVRDGQAVKGWISSVAVHGAPRHPPPPRSVALSSGKATTICRALAGAPAHGLGSAQACSRRSTSSRRRTDRLHAPFHRGDAAEDVAWRLQRAARDDQAASSPARSSGSPPWRSAIQCCGGGWKKVTGGPQINEIALRSPARGPRRLRRQRPVGREPRRSAAARHRHGEQPRRAPERRGRHVKAAGAARPPPRGGAGRGCGPPRRRTRARSAAAGAHACRRAWR